jgi:predicted RNA polymerase sigma factor
LRMMFSCCHPRLAEEAQVALVLQILCGFGVDEVASAFVTTHSAMEKRITRAKKVLAGAKKLFDVAAPADLLARLPAVQRALYLLFNEGYHGASSEVAVRAELCREAMRLTAVLLANRVLATPATYALAALMSLDAARLPARIDAAGNLNSLTEQDRSLWDKSLVTEGLAFLELSARGSELSEYHVEAAIASIHATAVETGSTDWRSVVSLYDTLMAVRPSPVIALNRAIAIGQLEGPRRGMDEIRAIRDSDRLAKYPFYEAAQGEFELLRNNHAAASTHFRAAMVLARNAMERRFFKQRVSSSEKGIQ